MPADPPLRFRSPVDAGGFVILAGVVLKDASLSDGAKVTYMLLLDYARQSAACWPGQGTLAEARGLKERAIRNHLTELEERGLITIEQRGLRQTNVYWIESVERLYHAPVSDRQKNAGQERQFSTGQERQKIAAKTDAEGNIRSKKQETLNVSEPAVPTPQHPDMSLRAATADLKPPQRPTNSESGIYRAEVLVPVEEAVSLTSDEKSRRRWVQLREVCLEAGATAAWEEALQKTRQRLSKGGVAAPGAYLQIALLRELDKRGVTVPSGSPEERDEARAAIWASLGTALNGGQET